MSKKAQLMFYIGLALVLIIFVVLFITSMPSGTKKESDVVPKNVAVLKDTLKLYNNKHQAYGDLEKEQEQEKANDGIKLDIGKMFGSKKINTDTIKVATSTPKKENAFPGNTEHLANHRHTQQNSVTKVNSQPVNEPVKNEVSDGFGIYTATIKPVETKAEDTKPTQNKFYAAYFEEDTKITNNSPIVIILREDAQFDGVNFKKNSTMFGYAIDAGNYFDLKITSIRNIDGTTSHVENLHVYNEKYAKGIVHEAKIDKAVKQSGDQTANNVASTVTGSTVYGQLATQAASTTVQALTSQRQPSIKIGQGYRVYVKSE